MPELNHSEEVLCDEILAEARRQSRQIIRQAQERAEALLKEAATAAENARRAKLDGVRQEAARRRELILATIPVEAGRLRLAQTEKVLQTVYEAVRQRLDARFGLDYQTALIALLVQAIERMAGNSFLIRISPYDCLAFEQALAENKTLPTLRPSLNITVSEDPTITDPGFIIQDPRRHQLWDNRLVKRLERLWPELRLQVAGHAGLISTGASSGGAL